MYPVIAVVPDEVLPVLIAAAGFALVLGLRQAAGALFAIAMSIVLLPALLAPAFELLPTWALWAALIFIGASLLRLAAGLMLGQRAADHMIGILAADVVRGLAKGTLRVSTRILRP